MNESIVTIKEKLAFITNNDDPYLAALEKDQRKGVQQLLARWKNAQLKTAKKEQRFAAMLHFEQEKRAAGFTHIAGIDEVGRGPLAGPVVASAVILPEKFKAIDINDSKQLSITQRTVLYEQIMHEALAVGIGLMDETVIDQYNIYEATRLAMLEAIKNLAIKPDYLLLDAMNLPVDLPQENIIKGDSKSVSIAAASIVAKVTRDRMMTNYAERFPGYGFAKNMGYGTKEHLAGLDRLGVCPIHRKSFAPVKAHL